MDAMNNLVDVCNPRFEWLNFCNYVPNPVEAAAVEAFKCIENKTFKLFQEWWKQEKLQGTLYDFEHILRTLQHYSFMIEFLVSLSIEIRTDLEYGICRPWSYYAEKYNIDCITRSLACKGIDFDHFLKIFGFPYADLDGINYMSIEVGCKIFTVNETLI